jgi:hypothetical protein
MGVSGQSDARAALPLEKGPGTPFTENWVVPRVYSGRVLKISSPPGFRSKTLYQLRYPSILHVNYLIIISSEANCANRAVIPVLYMKLHDRS